MNAISTKFLVAVTIFLSLLGCRNSDEPKNSPEEQIGALEAKVEKLEGKIDRIDSQFGKVNGAVLRLRNEIEDFGSENWKINVPDVEYEFEQLRLAVSELEREF